MGIQGLLPLLRSIHKPSHLRNFSGQTLGIDAYGWLHRGTVSCAIELAEQKPTRKHIDFALSRVRMLIHFGVKPYLVFDGDYLPSKEHTEKERAGKRKESRRLGLELLRMGRPSQAHLELQKAVDVTPSMARELIEELKALDVPFVVAPYEADAQLAYLEKQGVINGVLSEDSDLLVFGVKCLLTKLDQYGECVMINRADFTACRDISLVGWTDKEFRMMAMLSGCDYLPGIPNMGLKTAYRLVRKHKVIERLIRSVQFDGKMKVPPKYLDLFTQAERTFLYQWVFCSEANCLVNLNTVPSDVDIADMPYIGKSVEPELARGVAAGDLDPNTKQILAFHRHLPTTYTRQRIVQTPDEKQGKPITEFFKAKRTPLAELDPNSFTPSPSQQRLLQNQQGASWSATQVQAARLPALDRVATANRRASAPQALMRSLGTQRSDPQGITPKRQRLCSDSTLADSMGGQVGLKSATSRFFTKHTVQPSPSVRKGSRKDEFELWSDDAAAEAVANMTADPEIVDTSKHTPSPHKRKRMRVYNDPEVLTVSRHPNATDTSQSTTTTTLDETSQGSLAETAATSFESEESQAERTVFTKGVNANFAALKSTFSFQSTTYKSKIPTPRSISSVPRSPLQEVGRKHTHSKCAAAVGQSSKADVEGELDVVPASSPIATQQEQWLQTTNGVNDEEYVEARDLEAGLTALHGSEDLLVPNSPDSAEEDGRTRPKLDFSRFAFAG